jgi:hypothetical protein
MEQRSGRQTESHPVGFKGHIATERLSVDLSNFRIGEMDTPREAYRAMIEEEKEYLTNLAGDIIEHGLSPAERFIVAPNPEEPGTFIVHEGNRRVVALTLLENPALAVDTQVERAFARLAAKYALQPRIAELDCVVMKDKADALIWMERKHQVLEGRGTSFWAAPAQALAEAYRGSIRPSKAILDRLLGEGVLSSDIQTRLRRQTTNIDRVFQMPYLRKRLGIAIERNGSIAFDNGDNKTGSALLLEMLRAMAQPKFNVNEIRSRSQRQDFIDRFADHAVTGESHPDAAGSKSHPSKPPKGKGHQRPILDRKYLALPRNRFPVDIDEPRLEILYEEASNLDPKYLANCGMILLRVFLELSTEHYLKTFKVPLTHKLLKDGKTQWSEIQVTLKDKIESAIRHLDPAGDDRDLLNARRGLSGDKYLYSINTLHQYVHDLKIDVDGKEAKRAWGRWHPFWKRMFDAINSTKA